MRTCVFLFLLLLVSFPAQASLDLGPGDSGLSIGNSPRWTGVRLNFADHGIEEIRGFNFTLWRANGDGPGEGRIDGVGLGLWGPKAARLRGVHMGIAEVVGAHEVSGVGVSLIGVGSGTTSIFRGRDYGRGEMQGIFLGGLGVAAESDFRGIGVGGLGVGAGSSFGGLAVGGLGVGAGENVSGIAVGGLGVGVGEDLAGIAVGGLGAGVGGSATGAVIGLLGAGIGENFSGVGAAGIGMGVGGGASGLLVSGIGSGIGESFTGIALSGVGVGVGGNFKGLAVSGVGMGVGDRLTGIGIGGLGIGAEELRGLAASLLMTRGEFMQGVAVSAYNKWDFGTEGLAIGLLNVTDELKGVQLGVLNIAYSNPGWRRVLPIVNWGH